MTMSIHDDLKTLAVEMASDEADESPDKLRIYDCEDCGARFAAVILRGPADPPHFYLSAGGGKAFVAACAACGGTMISDIGPQPATGDKAGL